MSCEQYLILYLNNFLNARLENDFIIFVVIFDIKANSYF